MVDERKRTEKLQLKTERKQIRAAAKSDLPGILILFLFLKKCNNKI